MEDPVYLTSAGMSETEAAGIDRRKLVAYLSENAPDLNNNMHNLKIYRNITGYSNPPYILDFGPSASEKFILRKDYEENAFLERTAIPIKQQFELISILGQRTDIPVPKVFHFCDDAQIIGKTFYIMEFVEGRVFSLKGPHLPTLAKPQRIIVYRELVRVLAMIHTVDVDEIGIRDILDTGSLKWTVSNMYQQWQPHIEKEMKEENEAYASKLMTLSEYMKERMSMPRSSNDNNINNNGNGNGNDNGNDNDNKNNQQAMVHFDDEMQFFIHGDYHINNVIWHPTEMRIIAVVDWECAAIGNPCLTLGYFRYLLWAAHQTHFMLRQTVPDVFFTGFLDIDMEAMGIPTFDEFVSEYLLCLKQYSHAGNADNVKYVEWCLNEPNYIEFLTLLHQHRSLAMGLQTYRTPDSVLQQLGFDSGLIESMLQLPLEALGFTPRALVPGMKVLYAIDMCVYFLDGKCAVKLQE